jgi:hypothetical protein
MDYDLGAVHEDPQVIARYAVDADLHLCLQASAYVLLAADVIQYHFGLAVQG